MRLIDADEMLKRLESWNTDDEMDKALYNFTLNRIIEQPTVDAVPVRNGRWIRDEFGTKCGACGLYAYRDKFDQPWESPYCPNCGTRLYREGEEDETNKCGCTD